MLGCGTCCLVANGENATSLKEHALLINQWLKWSCYFRSLLVLCFAPRVAQRWVTEVQLESNFSKWKLSTPVLFFDIDDTLAKHGAGLTSALVVQLNHWVDEGHRVILLTNCSEGRACEHRSRRERWGKV